MFETVIGSGIPHSIEEYVERCFAALDLDWTRHVRTRPGYVAEYQMLVSDPRTIKRLGWEPAVSLQEGLRMTVAGIER